MAFIYLSQVPEIKGRSVKALQEARVLLGADLGSLDAWKDAAHDPARCWERRSTWPFSLDLNAFHQNVRLLIRIQWCFGPPWSVLEAISGAQPPAPNSNVPSSGISRSCRFNICQSRWLGWCSHDVCRTDVAMNQRIRGNHFLNGSTHRVEP